MREITDEPTMVIDTFKCCLHLVLLVLGLRLMQVYGNHLPIVVNTWDFKDANKAAWEAIFHEGKPPMDALLEGGSQCDLYQKCGDSVGFGAHPDESGETTLDAMVMDGTTHNVGAVAGLRRIKPAMAVAHAVMKYTTHTLLVGDQATQFAVEMGFEKTNLSTAQSINTWKSWRHKKCQPNYRQHVSPDARQSCGPYSPKHEEYDALRYSTSTQSNHDTIGMVVIGKDKTIVAGTTTNGLIYKVPGRVGDSPIVGSGAYIDRTVGAAVATGDGDIMMRFLPTHLAVLKMSDGYTPSGAAQFAINKIQTIYPTFSGAIVAVNISGHFGAACHNIGTFPYLVSNPSLNTTQFTVQC